MEESKEMPVSQGLINDAEVFQFVVWSETRRINTGITKMSNIRYRSIFMIVSMPNPFRAKTPPKSIPKTFPFCYTRVKKFFLHYLKDMPLKIVLLL